MLGPIYQCHDTTGLDKHKFSAYNCKYFLTHQFQHILCAQKNRLIETVLLSTHNIMFWFRNKEISFLLHILNLSPVILSKIQF